MAGFFILLFYLVRIESFFFCKLFYRNCNKHNACSLQKYFAGALPVIDTREYYRHICLILLMYVMKSYASIQKQEKINSKIYKLHLDGGGGGGGRLREKEMKQGTINTGTVHTHNHSFNS